MAVFIGGISGVKSKQPQYVFSVIEILGISEKTGGPIFGNKKYFKVRKSNRNSAYDAARSKYSYTKTGKQYFVELETVNK